MNKIIDKYISKVNYNGYANWNGSINGNVTSVGTNGEPSYYCTYDQSGNVWEIIDDNSRLGQKILRGGGWSCGDLYTISSSYRKQISIYESNLDFGLRLCASTSHIFSEWSFVDDINNPKDENILGGYGAVSYAFYIQKYPLTNTEYISYLNTVDPSGINDNRIYSPLMTTELQGGIIYKPYNQLNNKYVAKTNMQNKPVVNIDWSKAARISNWIHNGANALASTETGVYNMENIMENKSLSATCWIPLENEWYKAAYYDPSKYDNIGGYWKYATKNDITPMPIYSVDVHGNGPCRISCN